MKKIVLNILLYIPFILHAQSLSIQDLWDKLAETNTIKQKNIETTIANQNLAIEKLNKLPMIYVDANLQRNLIIPTTPVPAIAFDPSAREGAILPLKFATKWNSKAGVQAEWKFFDPARKTNQKEKQLQVLKNEINLKNTEQSIKKDATLAYASIVLATNQYQAAINDSIRYKQILESTTKRYEAGREKIDQYIIAKQEFERKRIQLFETYAVLRETNFELEKYIDVTNITQLTSDIETIKKAIAPYQSINYEAELNAIDIKLNDNDLKALKRQLLPTFTFNAYYGSQFFNNELKLLNSTNWYGNSYANVAVRLPISAYFLQNTNLAKINSERILNQIKLDESKKLDDIQTKKNKEKTISIENKILSLQNIIELSKTNINTLKLEYEAGRILLSEYNLGLNNHNSYLKELWQAQYDLLSSLLE